MIDINNIPVEPTVTVLNPDSSELITTNNITTLTYIRCEIKHNHLEGYSIRTTSGEIISVKPNGKVEVWTDEVTGTVFDKLLIDLI
jgi:hypothetical protein